MPATHSRPILPPGPAAAARPSLSAMLEASAAARALWTAADPATVAAAVVMAAVATPVVPRPPRPATARPMLAAADEPLLRLPSARPRSAAVAPMSEDEDDEEGTGSLTEDDSDVEIEPNTDEARRVLLYLFTARDHGTDARKDGMAEVVQRLKDLEWYLEQEEIRAAHVAGVLANEKVQLHLTRARILVECIRNAVDETVITRTRSPVAWREIMALTNTKSLRSAASAAGQEIAGAIAWHICMQLRPTLMGELAAGRFFYSDLMRIARRGIGLHLTVTKKNGMTEVDKRIIIKEGFDFNQAVDLAIAAGQSRREKNRKRTIVLRAYIRNAQLSVQFAERMRADMGTPEAMARAALPADASGMPAPLPPRVLAFLPPGSAATDVRPTRAAPLGTAAPAASAFEELPAPASAATAPNATTVALEAEAEAEAAPAGPRVGGPRRRNKRRAVHRATSDEDEDEDEQAYEGDGEDEGGDAAGASNSNASATAAEPANAGAANSNAANAGAAAAANTAAAANADAPAPATPDADGCVPVPLLAALNIDNTFPHHIARVSDDGLLSFAWPLVRAARTCREFGAERHEWGGVSVNLPLPQFLKSLAGACVHAGALMARVAGAASADNRAAFVRNPSMLELGLGESFTTVVLFAHPTPAGDEDEAAASARVATDVAPGTATLTLFIDPARALDPSPEAPLEGDADDVTPRHFVLISPDGSRKYGLKHGTVLVSYERQRWAVKRRRDLAAAAAAAPAPAPAPVVAAPAAVESAGFEMLEMRFYMSAGVVDFAVTRPKAFVNCVVGESLTRLMHMGLLDRGLMRAFLG